MEVRLFRLLLGLVAVSAGCGQESQTRFGRMPNDRYRPIAHAPLDGGMPFDFRWARIEPEAHVGQTRTCDVTFVGAREHVTRRIERRYAGHEVSERTSIRCRAPSGESFVDLVFPPEAGSFADAIAVGQRLTVEVIGATGGFENATVAEFRAIVTGAENVAAPEPILPTVPAAFDFRQAESHPELVGHAQPCGISWVGSIQPIPREARSRYPRGASHVVPIACASIRGESFVDVVATPRSAADLLRLARGERVSLKILATAGGTDDVPLTRLAR